jgi:MoxR-like ATPase
VTATTQPDSARRAADSIEALRNGVNGVVALDPEVLEQLLVGILARGHALIEGIPGIGKTLLARTLSRLLGLEFRRIQFTNDLMPSDIVGSSIWRPDAGRFEFVRGPLFTSLVLADEVNRTSPRTLSCLLEAMENGRVSVDGREHTLADPFLVLATRNPIEFHGTYPIPEAALDRFLVRVSLTYPSIDRELALYRGDSPEDRLAALTPAFTREELLAAMESAAQIPVSEPVAAYCYEVASATRRHDAVTLGASPRAAMTWIRAGRARAFLQGRDYVLPDDLKALAGPVLAHRVFLKGGGDAGEVVASVVASVPVPL